MVRPSKRAVKSTRKFGSATKSRAAEAIERYQIRLNYANSYLQEAEEILHRVTNIFAKYEEDHITRELARGWLIRYRQKSKEVRNTLTED